MTISIELRTHILRLYQAEHWRVGTIARQLHLHRDTVTRVLAGASGVVMSVRPRPRLQPERAHGQFPGRPRAGL